MRTRLSTIASLILTITTVMFFSCGDDIEEDGRNAANAFCKCLDDGYTMQKCEDKLKSNYGEKVYTHKDFKIGFDEVGKKCKIKWEITKR